MHACMYVCMYAFQRGGRRGGGHAKGITIASVVKCFVRCLLWPPELWPPLRSTQYGMYIAYAITLYNILFNSASSCCNTATHTRAPRKHTHGTTIGNRTCQHDITGKCLTGLSQNTYFREHSRRKQQKPKLGILCGANVSGCCGFIITISVMYIYVYIYIYMHI